MNFSKEKIASKEACSLQCHEENCSKKKILIDHKYCADIIEKHIYNRPELSHLIARNIYKTEKANFAKIHLLLDSVIHNNQIPCYKKLFVRDVSTHFYALGNKLSFLLKQKVVAKMLFKRNTQFEYLQTS
ncbi:hypothetical protein EDEG_02687 [Edhazardia aedis USNM 41457]|uniref:Uncharacterized protein n=1 Tax=Edhazardia aedis (strain USNM 41457) TaxID=1003232 RepID=J9DNF5_EDHAE|nr:hypothetical protein EDEG_02687 [Edhazardia aedis USNM 41457]|eukprot:EJW02922.1 hypothetical protein EDEG_02687 [Edhazardia aedis USNM 41457]